MKNLADVRDIEVPLSGGVLDGRNPAGTGNPSDFRLLLNCDVIDNAGRRRMPGWLRMETGTGPSNEDLHDQLLGAHGAVRSTHLSRRAYITPGQEHTFYIVDASAVADSIYGGNFVVADDLGNTFGPFTPTAVSNDAVTAICVADSKQGEVLAGSLLLMLKSLDPGDYDVAQFGGQREAVTLLAMFQATTKSEYQIAATARRIYTSTGKAKNWRIIADGLAGEYIEGDSPWPQARVSVARLGDYLLFTNGVDPVLAWPLGGRTIYTGTFANKLWSAFPVTDLHELGIVSASVVGEFNGFAFVADLNIEGTLYPGRIHWSDYNRPLEWAPGGESTAGYFDFGQGERVLALAQVGKSMRCYTDRAIYRVDFVGGNVVFLFTAIYRGDMTIAFKHSFANMGNAHAWLCHDDIVVLGEYDTVPRRYEWMRRASGFVFNGLDQRLLNNCPVGFSGFNPLDTARCHQIASGYDDNTGTYWLSWPTQQINTEVKSGNITATVGSKVPLWAGATIVLETLEYGERENRTWMSASADIFTPEMVGKNILFENGTTLLILYYKGPRIVAVYGDAAWFSGALDGRTFRIIIEYNQADDFEGVTRMALALNLRYNRASLVNHGFSAFGMGGTPQWESLRDFMLAYRVCEEDALLVDAEFVEAKEGKPLNEVAPLVPEAPTCIWNETEDPHLPKSESSLAASLGNLRMSVECEKCVVQRLFLMASTTDFCIKRYEPTARLRAEYLFEQDTPATFPETSQGAFAERGYPTIIQGNLHRHGGSIEKLVTRIGLIYDAETQAIPGKVYVQLAVTNSPHCPDYHDARPVNLDCRRDGAPDNDTDVIKASRPATFPFHRAGIWLGYRIFLSDADDDYSPKGCGVAFNELTYRAQPRNATWTNQP